MADRSVALTYRALIGACLAATIGLAPISLAQGPPSREIVGVRHAAPDHCASLRRRAASDRARSPSTDSGPGPARASASNAVM